ncbi:MAG: hypothetical protein ACP5I3_12665 [Thermoproteus sp.]
MGEGDGDLVEELERERRRNLEHNLKVVMYFAELAARDDPDYWRSYVEFINGFYRYVWRRLEDPAFRDAYLRVLEMRRRKPRREPPEPPAEVGAGR